MISNHFNNVAVIITGQPRNYWYTLPYIVENVITPNKADVFILLENGNCDASGNYIRYNKNELRDHFIDIIKSNIKVFKFEDEITAISDEYYQLLECSNSKNTQNIKAIFSQYLKKKYAFKLLESFVLANNKIYDTIMFLRPDIYYESFIVPKCSTNEIYLASRCGDIKCNWKLECFCIGGFHAMKKISLFVDEYGNLDFNTCINCKLGAEFKFVVEVQFGEYINKYNLEVKKMYFDIPSRRGERIPNPHVTSRNLFNINYPLKYVIDNINFNI